MVITDLDGTLFMDDKSVSKEDYNTLHELGKNGILRIAATGRSLYSAQIALNDNFPLDYLIFSTGAGILDWRSKQILKTSHLSSAQVSWLSEVLIENRIDFTIHKPIPDNHKFAYYLTGQSNPDFAALYKRYKDFVIDSDIKTTKFGEGTQIRAFLPGNPSMFYSIKKKMNDVKVIRATSPVNGVSIWMELFNKEVSKGSGIKWLCAKNNISLSQTLSVGNDYNDLDMLNNTAFSYVVNNAPEELKNRFEITADNQNSGFSMAVRHRITIRNREEGNKSA